MKAIKLLLGLSLCFALANCTRDQVRDFMPGTYVNSAGGEFSIASDTLKIELVEGNNYQVWRSTGYNLINDGKVGNRELEREVWSCAYSTATKTLTELKKGKTISFFPKIGILKVGRRVYQKMK
ncbi:hypothetical protein EZ428_18295 [Pedobacter frigiditerrae]|uniref:Lipoprotein n=1 Tax=Pedobacter frigiditerrae TaxID=2530452 RepID=A0A4R0MQN8_9SPHI|nr:hypothetical protein [Pedobacter frigiditerrae]TCC88592.1 hypothetical protein EZ428_18295 [Pedobacter frigiditerrae]